MVTVCILGNILKLVEVFLFFFEFLCFVFFVFCFSLLCWRYFYLVLLFCGGGGGGGGWEFAKAGLFSSIVMENTQRRTEDVFSTTGVFNHCSNKSRQPIHSASLKMYIGIFDFFSSKRYSSSRTPSECGVGIKKGQSTCFC